MRLVDVAGGGEPELHAIREIFSDGFKTAIKSGLAENDLVLIRTRETGPDSRRHDKSEAL